MAPPKPLNPVEGAEDWAGKVLPPKEGGEEEAVKPPVKPPNAGDDPTPFPKPDPVEELKPPALGPPKAEGAVGGGPPKAEGAEEGGPPKPKPDPDEAWPKPPLGKPPPEPESMASLSACAGAEGAAKDGGLKEGVEAAGGVVPKLPKLNPPELGAGAGAAGAAGGALPLLAPKLKTSGAAAGAAAEGAADRLKLKPADGTVLGAGAIG